SRYGTRGASGAAKVAVGLGLPPAPAIRAGAGAHAGSTVAPPRAGLPAIAGPQPCVPDDLSGMFHLLHAVQPVCFQARSCGVVSRCARIAGQNPGQDYKPGYRSLIFGPSRISAGS
ncbi:MAG: hypothetical protein ABF535_12550, partial [Acetobacter sp.]